MDGSPEEARAVPMVRISVGELAPFLVDADSGEVSYPVILNPNSRRRGEDLYQPLGGAVKLTEAGCKYFVENFDVQPNAFHEKDDARFEVSEARHEEVLQIFEDFNDHADLITVDITRELFEELTEPEIEGMPPILTLEEAKQVETVFLWTSRQPPGTSADTSPLAKKDAPSRRLFYIFKMKAPGHIIEKIRASPAIKFLAFEEIMTTRGGTRKGSTRDGSPIADNTYHILA